MARNNVLAVNEQQGALLQVHNMMDTSVIIAAESFPSDPKERIFGSSSNGDVVYGEPGTYVDVAERAVHLLRSLEAFGYRNQRLGFDTASNTRQYNREIYARYREQVPQVQDGAQANAERFYQDAKTEFWQATGYVGLRAAGIGPREELDAGARRVWRDFEARFSGPNTRGDRDAYKKLLKGTIRAQKRIIKTASAQR